MPKGVKEIMMDNLLKLFLINDLKKVAKHTIL